MKRVLFVSAHRPERSPSQRFRFEQYLPYLRENGWDVEHSWLITADDDRYYNAPGHVAQKAALLARSVMRRTAEALQVANYDVVFVHREALMVGPAAFERAAARAGARVVFDFDDAVWRANAATNPLLSWLKNTDKIARVIGVSSRVFAGNAFLADYARQHTDPTNVLVVPTTIDTDLYEPSQRPGPVASEPVCIGWSGSFSTVTNFEGAVDALAEVKQRFGERVSFSLVGDAQYRNARLGVVGKPWSAAAELDDLRAMDIGIMPLPDKEWERGKCGLKGLQYMALEIPAVMSPVGVNAEIVDDGRNGLLATTTAEWVEALSRLVESAELRRELGTAGRKTVERGYSVRAWRDVYLDQLDELAAR